jgi:hypothetical protein
MVQNKVANLTQAFADLRKMGFIAKQNFKCCNSCAGYKIAVDIGKMLNSGKKKEKITGCVYYNKQSGKSMQDGHSFYLQFGQVNVEEWGDIGLLTVECGKLIVQALTKNDIEVEWDGTEDCAILVKPVCEQPRYRSRW